MNKCFKLDYCKFKNDENNCVLQGEDYCKFLKPQPPSDLTRIADALEKIGKELEKANKLKVAEIPTDNYDGIPLKIREIMEG